MIGTIRRFGSIIVNDLRIAYPKDVAVRIDDAPATAADLKIGQSCTCGASRRDRPLDPADRCHERGGRPGEFAAPGRLVECSGSG